MGIGPVHVGARSFDQLAHTRVFRLGKVSKSEPRQYPGSSEQRNAIGYRCDGRILAQVFEQPLDPVIGPSGPQSKRPGEQHGKAGAAEMRRPNSQCVGPVLDAVVVDDDRFNS
jgi:hypothetical protein